MNSKTFTHEGVTYEVRLPHGQDKFRGGVLLNILFEHFGLDWDTVLQTNRLLYQDISKFVDVILLSKVSEGETPVWSISYRSKHDEIIGAFNAFCEWLDQYGQGFIEAFDDLIKEGEPSPND